MYCIYIYTHYIHVYIYVYVYIYISTHYIHIYIYPLYIYTLYKDNLLYIVYYVRWVYGWTYDASDVAALPPEGCEASGDGVQNPRHLMLVASPAGIEAGQAPIS